MSVERMQILEMVANGTITAAEAAKLIEALDESAEEGAAYFDPESEAEPVDQLDTFQVHAAQEGFAGDFEPEDVIISAGAPEMPGNLRRFRSFWYLPLAVGIIVTTFSALLVFTGNQAGWHWFWMSCAWLPLLLGIAFMMIAAMSRTARWVHVRVNTGQDEWPRRIAISLPLPLRASAWMIKVFGSWIPGLNNIGFPVDEVITALQDSLTPDDPIYVHVEDSGGEKVEVYIG